jgi:hypothetical protein
MRYTITNTCLTQPMLPVSSRFNTQLFGSGSQSGSTPATLALTISGQSNRHLVPDAPGNIFLDLKGTLHSDSTATDAVTLAIAGRMNVRVTALNSTATDAITFVPQWTETATSALSYLLPYGASAVGTATNAAHVVLQNNIPIASAAQTASNAYSLFADHVPATTTGTPGYIRFRVFAHDNTTNPVTYRALIDVEGVQMSRFGNPQ